MVQVKKISLGSFDKEYVSPYELLEFVYPCDICTNESMPMYQSS